MKRVIRRGVFETNSSSVHSLSFCSDDEMNKWMREEIVWDTWRREFIPLTSEIKEEMECDKYSHYYTFDDFFGYKRMEYETYNEKYVTPNGETVYAFGYYGYD